MTPSALLPIAPAELPAGWPACAGLHQAAELIWLAASGSWPDLSVEVLAEIDSTNSELVRRARAGRADRVLLVAQQQTAGRGRLGRSWHTTQTPALTLSLGLPMAPKDWAGLSLVVGLVVAQQLGHGVGIKWPNDLWWRGRKLCGILIETASSPGLQAADAAHAPHDPHAQALRYVVIGMGINLATPADTDLRTPPVGLRTVLASGRDASVSQNSTGDANAANAAPLDLGAVVMARIAKPLLDALALFEHEGFAPFEAAYAELDLLRNQRVTLSDGREGHCVGLAPDGALLVQVDGQTLPIQSGEVSVRPA